MAYQPLTTESGVRLTTEGGLVLLLESSDATEDVAPVRTTFAVASAPAGYLAVTSSPAGVAAVTSTPTGFASVTSTPR